MTEIYLDNAATTRPYPKVCNVVLSAMQDGFGNTASLHRRGVMAERQVAIARQHIRQLIGTSNWDVLFTSGGTEANNLAIRSCCPRGRRNVIITSTVEHASVADTAAAMTQQGCTVHTIDAGNTGVLQASQFAALASTDTALVSIIHVANEMGTVQPVNEIAKAVRKVAPRCKVHVDAVQAAAQLPRLDYCKEIDFVTISSHKIHGPQGVGALLFRTGSAVKPLLNGGDQQRGMRPGTLNLPGIAGMGEAARLTVQHRSVGTRTMQQRMDTFRQLILRDDIRQLGDNDSRAPGMLILAVDNVKSEVLLHTLEKYNVLASAGSACHSTRTTPPRCLVDAGLRPGDGVVRLSIEYQTTDEELARAAEIFKTAVSEVRQGKAGI
ncbi:MAG: cysteine desulfurase [Deltaproteobacteria bacterium]|nr:cysteine desulfurase [Deltaproteobacteria bacterium]